MDKKKKMIVCTSCGAEYDASLVRCPYCGTAYAHAEEDEYMGKLDDIRRDLETHGGDGDKSLKRGLGAVVGIVIAAAVVITLLFLGGRWLSESLEQKKARQQKEEFLIDQGIIPQQEEQSE